MTLTIGFIGNFSAQFSTECDRKWSFEKLGHTVVPFQENATTPQKISDFLPDADLLLYSHTHGWNIPHLKDIFASYKKAGVPTASAHLDRWLWLDRERDMGNEATWFTEWQFMADGSPEAAEKYDKMGLKWHHLKAGVVERDCYLAEPDRERFPHDIVFIGSKGYHKEYPGRPNMIDFLQETYGDRFAHHGGDGITGTIRGKDLNTLMASAKVIVGDSCFGGRPGYVSDRYYETPGRGGFLIHPNVMDPQTTDNPYVPIFTKGNLEALKSRIDYFLEHEDEREELRTKAHEWVKENATYTHRSKEMLEVMGLS